MPLGNGHYDAALTTTGLSRWHNYYLEGLKWLIEKVGIDGVYLDGIGYDREIMKRFRKVMERAKPGALIDFHSGNTFYAGCGWSSPACVYLEHFPYVDSIWFGEFFDYNKSPDYWLVEVSGIPFGLTGEMLEGAGNQWRGMIYGMSSRQGYPQANPKPVWDFWDQYQILGKQMIGYWDEACPVRTDQTNVLATAYVGSGRTLVALASWHPEAASVRLTVDWARLGLDPALCRFYAPAISGFQVETVFAPEDSILVAPARGWLLVIEPRP